MLVSFRRFAHLWLHPYTRWRSSTLCPNPGAGGIYGPGAFVATYTPGGMISISLLITAQHGGAHTFRLCGRPDATAECLNQQVLQR